MLDLNLRGVMLSTQLAIDVLGPGGAIVNIAATAGLGYGVHSAPEYAVAKAGLMRLTACLAPLRDSHGIRHLCLPQPDRHPSAAAGLGVHDTGRTGRRFIGHAS
jgi:NAD(P)-dependent dehydrogenase (short-subunit alcohol dehydrogenase family)